MAILLLWAIAEAHQCPPIRHLLQCGPTLPMVFHSRALSTSLCSGVHETGPFPVSHGIMFVCKHQSSVPILVV